MDLWDVLADARVITTNGSVKTSGRAVMGRGCALQATQRYAFLQLTLGKAIQAHGNHVALLVEPTGDAALCSFPVKHAWMERADLILIAQSATELRELTNAKGWLSVVLPRPGCGNGGRKWASEVRPILQPILDDRFLVVTQ